MLKRVIEWNPPADGRGDRIRTYDLLVPNQALYQTKLHPENHADDERDVSEE